MIKAISYWSMKDGLANTHPLGEALAQAKAAGFEGLEVAIGTEGEIATTTPRERCEALRETIEASGVAVETAAAGLAWGCSPTSDDAATRERSIGLHAEALRRAGWLGCRAMLMVPGVVTSPIAPAERVRYDHAVERVREAVKRLLDVAEEAGVDLCLENVWNGLFLSPLELRDFIDSFDSGRLGVYLDVGNVLRYHQWPPHWIELLAHRVKRVHIKGFRETFGTQGGYEFGSLLGGDVPWPETMAALRGIGYEGTIVAEMLPWREGLLEDTSRAMDEILAGREKGSER